MTGGIKRRIGSVAVLAVAVVLLASCQFQLAGPANVFGNDPAPGCTDPTAVCWGTQPNVWAAINGPFSRRQDGDPFATMCAYDTETRSTCDPGYPAQYGSAGAKFQNSTYNGNGYSWAVDVPAGDVGQPVSVEIYDPGVSNTGSPTYESDGAPTSDFHTSYGLFAPAPSGTDAEDPSLSMAGQCAAGPGYDVFGYGTGVGSYFEQWYTLCTFTPQSAGTWSLQVKTSDIPGVPDAGTGYNVYSVKALAGDGTGTQPDVHAVQDMSIWTAQPGSIANFYLAEASSDWAGSTMNVDLFDPGDGGGPSQFTLQVLAPPSGLGTVPSGGTPVACSYNSVPNQRAGGPVDTTASNCTIVTKLAGSNTSIYNGSWLHVSIQIPSTYTCTTDCWWSVRYDLGGTTSAPSDRTTWSVGIVAHAPSSS